VRSTNSSKRSANHCAKSGSLQSWKEIRCGSGEASNRSLATYPGHVPTTVTFELSPKDTRTLIAATDAGAVLSLALRPFGDNAKIQEEGKEIAPPPIKEDQTSDLARKAQREGYLMTVKNGPKWMQVPFQKRHGKFVSDSDRIQSSDSAPSGVGDGK
jgi:hypothetical protein